MRSIRILILGMNYAPEMTGIAPWTTEMAEYLAQRGHEVTVATTFPHYPRWRFADADRRTAFRSERRNGVRLYRSWVYLPRPRSTVQRVLYDTSLAVTSLVPVLRTGASDVILAIAPPLQLGLTALAAGMLRRAPVALLVKDLALEAGMGVGLLRDGPARRLARRLERFVYARSNRIAVISRGFADNLLAKGVPSEKISLLPNWIDTQRIRPLPGDRSFRERHGIERAAWVALHAGNMGDKQGLDNVVQAASLLNGRPQIEVVLVGDGMDRPRLQAKAGSLGLRNLRFLPLQPEEQVPAMLASADALLLNQRSEIVDSVMPGKLLTYLAAGRPVVAAVHDASETAQCIRDARCGVLVPPDDPEMLATALLRLAGDRQQAESLGVNGRRYAEVVFAREKLLADYEAFLVRLALAGRSV